MEEWFYKERREIKMQKCKSGFLELERALKSVWRTLVVDLWKQIPGDVFLSDIFGVV